MNSLLPEAVEAVEVIEAGAARGKWFSNTLQTVEKYFERTINALSGYNTVDLAAQNFSTLEPKLAKAIKDTLEPIEKKLEHDAAAMLTPVAKKIENVLDKIVKAGETPTAGAVAKPHHAAAHTPPAAARTGSVHAAATHELVGPGSTGSDVKTLQKELGVRVDGIEGPATTAALKAFQRAHGLTPDGIAGEKTWAALEPIVGEGSRGEAVRRIQAKLGVTVDGIDGPLTTAAIKQFQHSHGLTPDGIVEDKTWHAIDADVHHAGPTPHAAPPRDRMPPYDPSLPPGGFPFDHSAPYLKGGIMVVKYGGEDRAFDHGYEQSGTIASVKDGILTQNIGRITAEYRVEDLLRGSNDPDALQKMLVPGHNIQIAITPDGIQITDLDRQQDLDRNQKHAR